MEESIASFLSSAAMKAGSFAVAVFQLMSPSCVVSVRLTLSGDDWTGVLGVVLCRLGEGGMCAVDRLVLDL